MPKLEIRALYAPKKDRGIYLSFYSFAYKRSILPLASMERFWTVLKRMRLL